MKSVSKKDYLLGLSLLGVFLIAGFISITSGSIIINTTPDDSEHRPILHSLYLSGNVDEVLMGTISGMESLNVSNGLSVGGDVEGTLSSVGGGINNNVYEGTFGGVGGGAGNFVNKQVVGSCSAIGGGGQNTTRGDNSLIVGGSNNSIFYGGIILGGRINRVYRGGVVLGGESNVASGENSLVLGNDAIGYANSFAWNSEANENTARINANSGVLVGTYNPIEGVSLVVGGSVKLGDGKSIGGAINFNDSGCITMYDEHASHVLGKSSSKDSNCVTISGCWFGSALLQLGDTVTGYNVSYSTKCSDKKVLVQCSSDGSLISPEYSGPVYPYCYEGSPENGYEGGGGNGGGNGGGSECNICDVNGDGHIDIEDVASVNDCVAGIVAGNPSSWCDFNGDGEYGMADINNLPDCTSCILH